MRRYASGDVQENIIANLMRGGALHVGIELTHNP
jgi:hypothetical protein